MTDCNHAAKNIRSQLVLGSTILTGGQALFDVGLLQLVGVHSYLYYCVNEYASDTVVLKICGSDTISKFLILVENGSEDSMNIEFMAMPLYLLNAFYLLTTQEILLQKVGLLCYGYH